MVHQKLYQVELGWTGGNDIIFDDFFYNGSSSYYGKTVGNILVYSKELSAVK